MTELSSIALQVHHTEQMTEFYSRLLGIEFAEIDAGGMSCWFGRAGALTVKLVPLREEVDFESFPLHQLGFLVEDVDAAIQLAVSLGGRQEGEVLIHEGRAHGAVRERGVRRRRVC